jgi:hypothetical protein
MEWGLLLRSEGSAPSISAWLIACASGRIQSHALTAWNCDSPRWSQPTTISKTSRPEQLGRFLLRGLSIGASTISIIELLRNDWTGGVSAGVAWPVFLQVERRLPPLSPEHEE